MSRDATTREPKDGESYDKNGNLRPVPPGVSNTPDEIERAYYAEGSEKHHFREDCPHLVGADGPITSEVIRAPEFDAVPRGVSRRSPCQTCLENRGGDE